MMDELVVKIGIRKFELKINGENEIELNGKQYKTGLSRISKDQYRLKLNGRQYQLFVDELGNGSYITHTNGEISHLSIMTKLEEKAKQLFQNKVSNNLENKIIAPMNGLAVTIHKKVGDKIEVGDSLMVLEAMKMENEIKSTLEGVLTSIKCEIGNTIERGELLFIIE